MSTSALRHLLQLVRTGHEPTDISLDAAEREVERIETTAKTLSIHYTATIRAEGMPNAADLLESIAREAP